SELFRVWLSLSWNFVSGLSVETRSMINALGF
ncbi:MAG: hypothetical protein ACI814_001926, partial [Mariniblastus sp.]